MPPSMDKHDWKAKARRLASRAYWSLVATRIRVATSHPAWVAAADRFRRFREGIGDRLRNTNPRHAFFSPLLSAFVVMGGSLILLLVAYSVSPGQRYSLADLRPPDERALVLMTADGTRFAERGGCVAQPVTVADVPQHFIDALLSMEDRRFYSHFGVDLRGVSRAALRNWSAGSIVEGGSTITQQLAKITYLSSDKTMSRKRKEALIAVWLELRLSKDEILDRYLSSVYFGEGCFGLRAAAKHYFGRQVGELSLPESAYLVALLKSPAAFARNREAARERARLVFEAMVDNGKLKAERLDALAAVDPRPDRHDEIASYYADWVAGTVSAAERRGYQPLKIRTSFDAELQRMAEGAVETIMTKYGDKRRATQSALVAMRTDGRVVAMVGGRDYADSQFNRAVQALRQPGSAFKLFVYLAALRAGADPSMTVVDEPIAIGEWEPENFGGRFRGPVPLSTAFASSINTVAVQLSEAVGRKAVIAAARDLGITTPLTPNPSIALGVSEVSLLELTSAFAAVAAGAYPVKPWGVAALDDAAPGVGAPPRGSGAWLLTDKENMRQLLSGVVNHGSGTGARLPIPTFGKTGTSQEHRDAWFIGFAGNLVVGVWVGNDDNTPMKGVTGGSLPASIWREFMTQAMKSDPGFERKLPQIAAFEARTPPSSGGRLARLDLLSPAYASPLSDRGNAEYGFGPGFRPYFDGPDPRSRGPEYSQRRSSGRSPDFNQQLKSLGFPMMN